MEVDACRQMNRLSLCKWSFVGNAHHVCYFVLICMCVYIWLLSLGCHSSESDTWTGIVYGKTCICTFNCGTGILWLTCHLITSGLFNSARLLVRVVCMWTIVYVSRNDFVLNHNQTLIQERKGYQNSLQFASTEAWYYPLFSNSLHELKISYGW